MIRLMISDEQLADASGNIAPKPSNIQTKQNIDCTGFATRVVERGGATILTLSAWASPARRVGGIRSLLKPRMRGTRAGVRCKFDSICVGVTGAPRPWPPLVWLQMQQLDQALAEFSNIAARSIGSVRQEPLETSGLKRRGQVRTAKAVLGE